MPTLILCTPTSPLHFSVSPERLNAALDDTWSVHLMLQQASSVVFGDSSFSAERRQRLSNRLERIAATLFTPEQLESLAAAPDGSTLLIRSDLPGLLIPWEQLPAGRAPAGLRFAIGRQFITHRHQSSTQAPPFTGTGCVVAAESHELISTDLEHRIVERRLRPLLTAAGRLSPLNPAPTPLTADAFKRLLCENTWLHFAGHAVRNPADTTAARTIVLGSSTPESAPAVFTVADVQQLPQVPRGVFLNACGTLQLPLDEQAAFSNTLAGAFLERGVELLIGPVVPIADSHSRSLVRRFYDALAEGLSAAEALRLARAAAIDSLGPDALLPWCYVLYGDPARIPFPAPQADLTSGDTLAFTAFADTPAADDQPHCRCVRCQTVIRTRHGVYGMVAEPIPGPVCRDCAAISRPGNTAADLRNESEASARRSTAPTPAPANTAPEATTAPETAPPSAAPPAAPPAAQSAPARALSESERLFVDWLHETLLRTWTWRNPDRHKAASCRFEAPANLNTRQAIMIPDNLTDHVVAGTARELVDEHGCRLPVTFVLASTDFNKPIDSAQLADIVSGLTGTVTKEQACSPALLVIAAANGFDPSTLEELQQPSLPAWYPPHTSVILWEPAHKREHRRRLDLLALRFPSLLSRPATASQIATALERLQHLLPLPTSLSSQQLAIDWQLEPDAIETAMQITALENHLQLDKLPDLGLVISTP